MGLQKVKIVTHVETPLLKLRKQSFLIPSNFAAIPQPKLNLAVSSPPMSRLIFVAQKISFPSLLLQNSCANTPVTHSYNNCNPLPHFFLTWLPFTQPFLPSRDFLFCSILLDASCRPNPSPSLSLTHVPDGGTTTNYSPSNHFPLQHITSLHPKLPLLLNSSSPYPPLKKKKKERETPPRLLSSCK